MIAPDARSLAGKLTLTVRETAALLSLSEDVTYRAVHNGEIPALRVGRRWIVPTARLLELLGANGGSGDAA